MPLMSGKSKQAFSHNVGAEMDSGKPQNQALAIAYAVKRKNKKAMGGMVNEKLDPMHEPADVQGPPPQGEMSDASHEHLHKMGKEEAMSMAHAIMQKHCAGGEMGYSDGGEVEEDDFADSEDDMFAPDAQLGVHNMASGGMMDMASDSESMEDPEMKKKKMMSSIMSKVRMEHMGRK